MAELTNDPPAYIPDLPPMYHAEIKDDDDFVETGTGVLTLAEKIPTAPAVAASSAPSIKS
jgi:hypothetical protein